MKKIVLISFIAAIILFGCGEDKKNNLEEDFSSDLISKQHLVEVKERLDAGGYSYLRVDEKGNEYWIAISVSDIVIGEEIVFSKYMEMKDFRSEKLDRTFPSLLFVEDVRRKDDVQMPNPHQMQLSSIPKEEIIIEKAKDGFTIEELYIKKNELNDKIVKVRGKVVKANLGIMNLNWFHIQDGTGKDGTHDLTIISSEEAKVGDKVLIEGTLVKDRDFGSGYIYPLIVENSKIIKE